MLIVFFVIGFLLLLRVPTNDKEIAQEMREFGKMIGEKMVGENK